MATNGGNGTRAVGPRCVALVGPFQSGKTTLLEAILARTGAVARQGTIEAGNTVGDASKEARHHRMSVELRTEIDAETGGVIHASRPSSIFGSHARLAWARFCTTLSNGWSLPTFGVPPRGALSRLLTHPRHH